MINLFEFDNQQKKEAEKPDPVVNKYKKRVEVAKEYQDAVKLTEQLEKAKIPNQ